jgi:MFS family permease
MLPLSERFGTTFRSLRYQNYRLFFCGQSISLVGTWIQRIATPWLVYHLTGSAFLLGLVGFAGQLPTFLLSPFAGVFVDRWNKFRVLIATQIGAMIQALLLALLYFSGHIQVWHIVVLNVILGTLNALDVPARQSLVVRLVDRKEDLPNAIALNSSMVNGARLIGPSIAGVLIAWTGEGACYLINGLSYIFVIASLLWMRLANESLPTQKQHIVTELKEGIRYTFGSMPIRNTLQLLAISGLMGMSYSVLMPVFAKEFLHGGAHTFGFLMGATGLGALSGALYLASRKGVAGLENILPYSTAVFGLAIVGFSVSRCLPLSLLLLMLVGAGMMLQMATSNTILQSIVEDSKRGRVMSFYTMAFMGTAPFGSLLAGSLAKAIGAPATLMVGGLSCLVGALLFARRLPKIRTEIHRMYRERGIHSI